MTCRVEVLAAMERLERRTGRTELALVDIVREVFAGGSALSESTIRTHVTSSMCIDAPPNHSTRYPDLRRTSRGIYQRV
jgi:hypothetical protein